MSTPICRARSSAPFSTAALARASAALVARASLDGCEAPRARAALERIAEDEARHAELAWKFVAWAVQRGGEPIARVLQSALERGESGASPRHLSNERSRSSRVAPCGAPLRCRAREPSSPRRARYRSANGRGASRSPASVRDEPAAATARAFHLTERIREQDSAVSGAAQHARIAKGLNLLPPRKRKHAVRGTLWRPLEHSSPCNSGEPAFWRPPHTADGSPSAKSRP
jgi:hypothetical protein